MTRESKAGLLMIVMLISIFGFMVYKRFHQPSQAMAQQDSGYRDSSEWNDARRKGADPVSEDLPARELSGVTKAENVIEDLMERPDSKRSAARREKDQVDEANREADPFADIKASAKPKPKLPTELPDDGGLETRRSKSKSVAKEARKLKAPGNAIEQVKAAVEEADPFASLPVSRNSERRDPEQSAVAAQSRREDPFAADSSPDSKQPAQFAPPGNDFEERSSRSSDFEMEVTRDQDPFEKPVVRQETPLERIDQKKPKRSGQSVQLAAAQFDEFNTRPDSGGNAVPDPGDSAFEEPQVRPREQKNRAREERDAFGDGNDPFRPNVQGESPVRVAEQPRRTGRPAPVAQIDEDFASQGTAQPLVAGDSYEVEPSDNFWTISRKRYGTGRYFMALAQHNAKKVPDPKMMKPGLLISTPSAQHLERTYPQLIPKSGPSGSVGPIQTASLGGAAISPDTPAGFYVSNDGTPMYRVGNEDTLSDIAQRHLGRSSRWVQIYHLNRDMLTDGNTLKIGMQLRLPADASRVEVVGGGRTFR